MFSVLPEVAFPISFYVESKYQWFAFSDPFQFHVCSWWALSQIMSEHLSFSHWFCLAVKQDNNIVFQKTGTFGRCMASVMESLLMMLKMVCDLVWQIVSFTSLEVRDYISLRHIFCFRASLFPSWMIMVDNFFMIEIIYLITEQACWKKVCQVQLKTLWNSVTIMKDSAFGMI